MITINLIGQMIFLTSDNNYYVTPKAQCTRILKDSLPAMLHIITSILVLMDMSKAFDSINLNTLLEVFKLRRLGVSPSAMEWIVCFYWGCGFAVSPS